MKENDNWKVITLVIGGIVGLITGLAAALLLIKRQEETGEPLKITSGEGAKIGFGIITLLRHILGG